MIIKCEKCIKYFDDQFRYTGCPHNTFSANDGQNNFKHHPEAWLADREPKIGFSDPNYHKTLISEYDIYQEWLNKNKIKV